MIDFKLLAKDLRAIAEITKSAAARIDTSYGFDRDMTCKASRLDSAAVTCNRWAEELESEI